MKNIKLIFLLLTLSFLLSCGKKEEAKEQTIYKDVKITSANLEKFDVITSYTGSLDSIDEVKQITETGGYIKKVNYKNGDFVKRGAIVLEMEDKNVEASYLDTKSRVTSTKSDYDKQKLTFKKYTKLYKEKYISEEEYLNMKIKLAASKGNYESATAAYTRAKKDYNNLIARAKLSGQIANLNFKFYQKVDPNTPLFIVVDNSKMRVLGAVSGKNVVSLEKGAKAKVVVGAINEEVEATLTEINPIADPNTRKFQVRVELDNKDRKLKSGMYSKVNLMVGEKEGILVPKKAVVIEELVSYVYLVEEVNEGGEKKSRVKKIKVEQGETLDEMQEIISPELKDKNKIVVEGQFNIDNGSYVNIVE
jgi:RND family efflux transporter MFP subunit